jgi:pilus assembly protein Flp/PilA
MINKGFLRNNHAATAIEYGLIAGLIAVAMIVGLRALGGGTGGLWGNIADSAGNAMSNAGT